MLFNFIVSIGIVSDIFTRLFQFLDDPDERPWVAIGAFAIFVILGAAWIHQSQVLPGVSVSDTQLSGQVIDMYWNEEGTQALALIESASGSELMLRDSTGTWTPIDCDCTPTSIGGTSSSWVIGGADGWMGMIDSGPDAYLQTRPLEWPSGALDIVSLDGSSSAGWMIAESGNGMRTAHTWDGLSVSNGTAAPLSTIILTDVEMVSGGSLLIGHDLSAGNPADGPTAEVLIDGANVIGGAPVLDLLHLGAGQSFHTIIPVENGPWYNAFIGIVAGGDSTYGIQADRSVHRIPGAFGSDTIALDSTGSLWMSDGDHIETIGMGDESSNAVVMPASIDVDISSMYMAGDNIVMISVDGAERISIDPSAQHSLLHSLQLLGDVLLILVLFAFGGFGGHALLRKHDVI
jgi:hypothetical protein